MYNEEILNNHFNHFTLVKYILLYVNVICRKKRRSENGLPQFSQRYIKFTNYILRKVCLKNTGKIIKSLLIQSVHVYLSSI